MSKRDVQSASHVPGRAASFTTTLALPLSEISVVAAPPELLTQHNVLSTIGMQPRAFLDELRRPGFPLAVIRVGKTRFVDRREFRAWLASQSERAPEDVGADEILAGVGYESAPAPRKSTARARARR